MAGISVEYALPPQIIEGVWDRLADALTKHEIDLALGVAAPASEAIVPIPDCRWEDTAYVVASITHPLRQKGRLQLADTLQYRWACTPRGTAPYLHMQQTFEAHGLACPDVVVETRSIIALKSMVAHAGFLCWMAGPMFADDSRAKLIDALDIPGLATQRQLTVFRRRDGILPGPAVKLLDALRHLTENPH